LKEKDIDDQNELPKETKGKYKRKTKKKRKRALKVIRFLLLTVLSVATLLLLALSQLFNISGIEVSGNNHYNDNEIIEVTNLIMGNNWFRTNGLDVKSILLFRSIQAEQSIKENCHYVKNVAVKLSIPKEVKITVTEREPFVISPYADTNLLIDVEGYILDSKKEVSSYSLLSIQGLGLDNCEFGHALNAEDKKKFDIFKMVIEEINKLDNDKVYDSSKAIFKHLNYVDVADWDNVGIMLDSRIRVNLGNYKKIGSYRLSFLREVFFNKLGETDKGYLDFTTGDTPSFIPDK
jgi:cell division protein FtsQ